MLSHPSRIAAAISATRPGVRPTRGSLTAVGAALALIALGTRLGSPPVEGAPAAAVVPTGAVSSAPAASPAMGCWVTGDLVGGGNPAELAAALCDRK